MTDTKAILQKTYDTLCVRKTEIDAKAAPLAAKREKLWEKIHPVKAEIDKLAAEEKAIKGDDYHVLCQEIGQLAVKLGGKKLSGN